MAQNRIDGLLTELDNEFARQARLVKRVRLVFLTLMLLTYLRLLWIVFAAAQASMEGIII